MTSGLEFCQPSGRLIFRQRRLGSSASLKKKERKTCGLPSAALQSRANVLASFLKVTQRLGTQFSNCVFFLAKKCHLASGFSCDTGYSGTLEIFGILAIPANLAIPVEMSGFCWNTGYFILFFIYFYFAIFILFWNFLRLENWRLEIRCQRKIGMKGSHFTRNFTELTMS